MTTLATERFNGREAMRLILPKEHGSWSLALEPLAFGLLAATSPAGFALALAAVAGFFLRRPLKIIFREPANGRRELALACGFILGLIALAGALVAMEWAGPMKLWPLVPAMGAGLAFVWFDSRNEGREGAAEVAGAIAFGMLPAAFGSLAGLDAPRALALAAIMLMRSVPTVLLVRTCLRLKKGHPTSAMPAIIAATLAAAFAGWLIWIHLAPWPAILFAIIFLGRTLWLLARRQNFSAKTIGITEMALGIAMVLSLGIVWKFF
jgi:YwiC-like protein